MVRTQDMINYGAMQHRFTLSLPLCLFLALSSAEAERTENSDTVTVLPIEKGNDKKAFAEAFVPRDRSIQQTMSLALGSRIAISGQRLAFRKGEKTEASVVLHVVYFSQEKQEAHSSAIVVDVFNITPGPTVVTSAWFYDWRVKGWSSIAPEKVSLSIRSLEPKGKFVASGWIMVPPMMFMGEPEGNILLIDNPLNADWSPQQIADSVNGLLRMKPVFR